MRRLTLAVVLVMCCILLLSAAQQPAAPSQSLYGFRDADAAQQRDWETKFRAIPSPQNMRSALQRLSARPHHVGSPYDKDNAEWLQGMYKSWGLDAQIESFDVLFPTPKDRAVEMLEPTRFVAKLQEPAVAADPTSNQHAEQLPTYNAYSIDGDVTAPLVFVNYGIPADYDELDRLGISVKGAIVITKYGGSWRGIKPKVAAEHGAVGCLIYSDPRDDGYFMGDVFPKGAWRPPDGVQRGSVMDMPVYPGDPMTPGVGAVPGAKRLDLKDVKTITKIPVLPISYADAQPLLAALTGPMAPMAWRGALPMPYHIGPGPAKVHLKVASNWDTKRLYDVIVRIPGSTYPDEWIVRGNHHDGWVNGAQDPLSGLVAEMEELRAYSELLKQGWKPKRTIIYAAWDGEEPGLLGSTEWAEAHGDELKQKAVAYINSDGNSRGYLGASGSHTLEHFFNSVAREITDPEKNINALQRAKLVAISRATTQERKDEIRSRPDLRIEALGSGSDYTAFLDHLGIASMNLGYGGEAGGGIYHSIYDDFYWYTHFDDPDFVYGRALAQTAGTAVLRLAGADLLPFDFADQADTVRRYVRELETLLKTQQDETKERDREMQEGLFNAVSDPKHPLLPPKQLTMPPFLNFAPLDNGADALSRAAERYQKAAAAAQQSGLARVEFANTNKLLMQSERRLTLDQGLPNRPWFRHQLYAPGFYTGYGVKTIPAVREAIEQREYPEAEAAIARVGRVLQDEAALINQAAESLERAK
jgi:N-acetylated-alpha-linked acidic dipeptidase